MDIHLLEIVRIALPQAFLQGLDSFFPKRKGDAFPNIGSRLRKLIESETEGIDKQTGAPNQNNLVMLLKQLFQAGKSLYFILASRIRIFDAQIINKMMNYAIELAGRGLGRADRHFTVELPGICRNNFSFVMLGYPQAQFCFADCGGSYNADKGFRMT